MILARKMVVQSTTSSGLILTDNSKEKNNNFFEVISKWIYEWKIIIVSQHGIEKVILNNEEFFFIANHQVLGTLSNI